jgi:hypothetical protein
MTALWPQYFDDCLMLVFVVDASDAASIAPAAVELCEVLQHPKMEVRRLALLSGLRHGAGKCPLKRTRDCADHSLALHPRTPITFCKQGKPICVVLSKQDQGLALSRQEIELVMQLSDFERSFESNCFKVLELSSIPAGPQAEEGGGRATQAAEVLLEWIIERKCVKLGLNIAPKRAPVGGLFTPT